MTVALRSPEYVSDLVAVDNAPVDAALKTAFAHYVKGMKMIEDAGVTRQSEADAILRDYEEASAERTPLPQVYSAPMLMRPICCCSRCQSDNFSLETFINPPGARRGSSVFLLGR